MHQRSNNNHPRSKSPVRLSLVANGVRVALLGAGLGLISGGSNAASIVVTSNTDDNTNCTLREALGAIDNAANQNGCTNVSSDPFGTNDLITFSTPGNIILADAAELSVNSNVVIDASSVSGVTVNAVQASRVFNISGSLDVTLDDLTITGGSTSLNGGGIFVGTQSELSVVDSIVTSNQSGDYGGGMFVGAYSNTTIMDSEFSSNVSAQDGGGMYFESTADSAYEPTTATLTNTMVTGNTASGDQGGGIWSYGYSNVVSLIDSVVDNNRAGTQGGGIYAIGENSKLTISGGSVDNNEVMSQGGGLYLGAFVGGFSATFEQTTVSGNSAGLSGGGIVIQYGSLYSSSSPSLGTNGVGARRNHKNSKPYLSSRTSKRANGRTEFSSKNNTLTLDGTTDGNLVLSEVSLQMTDTNVNGNSAGGVQNNYTYGGGILASSANLQMTRGQVSGNLKGYYGGGITAFNSQVTLIDATVSGNSSIGDGGAIYSGSSTVTLTNSTISDNHAGTNGDHEGGGIWSSGGYLDLNNSTVSGNSVYYSGGGIWSTGVTTLTNTTISDNTTGFAAGGIKMTGASLTLVNTIIANSTGGDDCVVDAVTSDSQSIIEDDSCGSATSGDPGLKPLTNNGGPTKTHALSSTSIALDSGDNQTCLVLDQRGRSRSDGRCDVGAFELEQTNFIVIPLDDGKAVVVPN